MKNKLDSYLNSNLDEGQTQVYLDHSIDKQYGTDTSASYLNTPPKQLLDLIEQFYKSKKSDSQVLAILVGMGIPQQLAVSGISTYKSAFASYNENIQKNHNKMNFTLNQLYENVTKSIDTLKTMKADGSRISYSASTAINILEKSLEMFPSKLKFNLGVTNAMYENSNINYESDRYAIVKIGEIHESSNSIPVLVGQQLGILLETSNDESSLVEKTKRLSNELGRAKDLSKVAYRIIELTESKVTEISNFVNNQKTAEDTTINEDVINPNLKYKIAKVLHRDLTQYDWLIPVQELRAYIDDMYNDSKWSFRISEAIERNSLGKGTLIESLVNDLNNVLKESSNIKSNFTKIASKHPWSSDVKFILNEMAAEDRLASSNANANISKVLSPVIENENGLNFYLHGKTYAIKGSKIVESIVNDQRFFNVLEGLKLFKHINNSLVVFGKDDKSLEYELTEGTLTLGKTDLSELSPDKIKESLLASNFFGYKHHNNADIIAKFFESIDYLYEMDNFTNITSNEYLSLFLTMIAVEEGFWVNKINTAMKLNEMVFVPSATRTVQLIKEFINYDVSAVLSEKLISEGNVQAKTISKRTAIADQIAFLEDKKTSINETINKIGKSAELDEALSLIKHEIEKFEKELQETYSIEEKKTKAQYLNDGYVEANVFKPTLGLTKDQVVMVKAEDYTSLDSDDNILVIVPETQDEKLVKKSTLKVQI